MAITKNVVVVGGGASGLMCALTYARKGNPVTILEGSVKVGKKILVSGNGRCNLTNKNISEANYNVFPKQFKQFNNTHLVDMMSKLGLVTYYDQEGRGYPLSNHSSSVLDVLLNALNSLPCEIITNCKVEEIESKNNGFYLKTTKGEYKANKVVIATGGKSMENTLKDLGIKYSPFKPSLCGLVTKESTKLLAGIRTRAVVSINHKKYNKMEEGEVIFKDNGISGICVFNMSAGLNWANIDKATLSVNICPDMTSEQLLNLLKLRKQNLTNLTIQNYFDGMFQKNLSLELCKRCNLDIKKKVGTLTDNNISQLADTIQNLSFSIIGFDNNNQVHNGGVGFNELNDNLECISIPGLYFCGEIIDVDGACGGYNLQWAWTSGHIVGEAL